MRELFREGDVRGRIDALRDRLSADPPPNADRLYPELHDIFLRSGYRDEVKYAMALMSGFGRPEDADAASASSRRHEEFTLYAAVALATVSDDPFGDWLALLPQVKGWGRIELAELILREPLSAAERERLCAAAPAPATRWSWRTAAGPISSSLARRRMTSCCRGPGSS